MAPRGRSVPRSLRRDEIVRTARELVAEEGFEALTMRHLAERCGVGTMTLYGHLRTKEDLLADLANTYLEELVLPGSEVAPWNERVRAVFRDVRRLFLEYPHLAFIVASQPLGSIVAFRGAEVVLGALAEAGVEGPAAIAIFDVLSLFTLGFAQREASEPTVAPTRAARIGEILDLPREEFPHLRRTAADMIDRTGADHLDDGLNAVLAHVPGATKTE